MPLVSSPVFKRMFALCVFVFGTQVGPLAHRLLHAREAREVRLCVALHAIEHGLLDNGIGYDERALASEFLDERTEPDHSHESSHPTRQPHGTGSLAHGDVALDGATLAATELVDAGFVPPQRSTLVARRATPPRIELPPARAPPA